LDRFAYIGVYSSGLIGEFPGGTPATGATWETRNLAMLDNASLKKGLKLLWFSTGKEDGLINTSQATVDLLKKHGFNAVFEESPGAHTWINWRNYLNKFAPQLFQ
jgi:enterochelin esterase family protein